MCNNNNNIPNSQGGGDSYCRSYDGDKGKCRMWSDSRYCPNDNSRKTTTYASMYSFNSTHFEYKMWSSYMCQQSTGRSYPPANCRGSSPLQSHVVIPLKTCMPGKTVTREDEPLNLCRKFTDSRRISSIDTCAAWSAIADASMTPKGLSRCTKKTWDELEKSGCNPTNYFTPWMYAGPSTKFPLPTCPIDKGSGYKNKASEFLKDCAAGCGCFTASMNYLKN